MYKVAVMKKGISRFSVEKRYPVSIGPIG